jgi:hypothetical protein
MPRKRRTGSGTDEKARVTVSTGNWKQLLFTARFLVAAAVATISWLIALGWLALNFAQWLFF